MPTPDVFAAVAFATRAHQGQFRKDGKTPYASHVMRVCLVVRHVFGFDDPEMLCAALLHDTIEDTTTDRDDIDEHFGPTVGKWVAALTKNATLPFEEREAEYRSRLAAADWQVKACKLADIYDNMGDVKNFAPAGRRKNAEKSRKYIAAMRPTLPEQLLPALALVEARLAELAAGLTS
jgi:guanosine-3',5'-bis(diphosphate) 3'-pyrophosphohydrolase